MRKFAKISEFLEKNINSKRDHLVSFFIYEIYLLLYISYLKYNLMTIKRKSKFWTGIFPGPYSVFYELRGVRPFLL